MSGPGVRRIKIVQLERNDESASTLNILNYYQCISSTISHLIKAAPSKMATGNQFHFVCSHKILLGRSRLQVAMSNYKIYLDFCIKGYQCAQIGTYAEMARHASRKREQVSSFHTTSLFSDAESTPTFLPIPSNLCVDTRKIFQVGQVLGTRLKFRLSLSAVI